MRVRLAAQGEVGPGGGPAGDLYVEVHEQPHDIFVRDGDDLHCTISVPMVDAALGTTVTVDAILDGLTEITIPRGDPARFGDDPARPRDAAPALRATRRSARARRGGGAGLGSTTTTPNCCASSRAAASRDVAEVRSTHSRRQRRIVQPAARDLHRALAQFGPRMLARCSTSTRCPTPVSWPSSTATKASTPPPCAASVPARQLVLGDGAGGLARCVVEQAGRDGLQARVLDRWQRRARRSRR